MVPTLALMSRRLKLSLPALADIAAPVFAFGLAVGKIGCFLAGCCHGTPTQVPWAVTFNHPDSLAEPKGVPLHPSQLYEAAAWFALMAALLVFRQRRSFPGEAFLAFVVGFCGLRSGFELLRANSVFIGPFTSYQWISIPSTLLAAGVWIWLRRRNRNTPAEAVPSV
jgi:phosphatidylglycerol:prolipoprotein diacylglycerol transferase